MSITEIRIEGLRTIEKVHLRLGGLTVLIGDNGTGKSSILEACEILRRATGPRFLDDFYGIHGGLAALLRQGASRLLIGITVDLADDPGVLVAYDLIMAPRGDFAAFEEVIRLETSGSTGAGANDGKHKPAGKTGKGGPRPARVTEVFHGRGGPSTDQQLTHLAAADSPAHDEVTRERLGLIHSAAKAVLVNLPFETTPAWAARALDRKSALRGSALLTPADHLDKLGLNLASAYHALKNNFGRPHWDATLDYLRLGLGERVEDVVTWADPGGGNIGLSIKMAGLDRPIPSSQLSDGMLSYLAFVALFRLHATKPSLVAFDEPDLHLHPHLLMRVLEMFEAMAREYPVLLATHSDRLLDALREPARSVVLCELDDRGATRLVRPDAQVLAKWLERYRGLGDIRSAGHAASVLTKVEPS